MRLFDKIALVTGGGRGMGAAICRLFAAEGARVFVVNRTASAGEDVAAEIRAAGHVARALGADIGTREAATRSVEAAVAAFGGLDILVHNAALFPHKRLEEVDDATLDATLAVNLKACFWLTQAALPSMRARGGGRILITSSTTGPRVAFPGLAHYAASKGGVNAFVRAAALELAPDRITVNCVEPGFIAKPGRGSLSKPETKAGIERYIPLGAMGEPEDVAHAMLYLASDEARYVTGQALTVDGGMLLPESGFAMDRLRNRG